MIPSFFNDDSDTDKWEETMDVFISWTLRCAPEHIAKENRLLQKYSKQILLQLLFDESDLEKEWLILEVKTYRQWQYIDILVEVKIQHQDGSSHQYVLVIENKVYSNLSSDQLLNYDRLVTDHYADSTLVKTVVIAIDDCRYDQYQPICNSCGVRLFNVGELSPENGMEYTGNNLFDEFWFRFNKELFGLT